MLKFDVVGHSQSDWWLHKEASRVFGQPTIKSINSQEDLVIWPNGVCNLDRAKGTPSTWWGATNEGELWLMMNLPDGTDASTTEDPVLLGLGSQYGF